ncbi:MAG: hypothetical protein NTV51_04755 [Verrucomicrobia bacterium]|nr:hypothetical protein [Verrucomicrobiota bacterium]
MNSKLTELFSMRSPVPGRSPRSRSGAGAVVVLALGLTLRLGAQTVIPVVNFSFETPTPSTFPDYTVGATGWTLTRSDIPAGTFAPTSSGVTPAPIDGNQVGYANGSGGLQQVLSTAFVAGGTYTYSVYIGNRSDGTAPTGNATIELGYFDTTFHPLASQSAAPALGNFDFVSGSYLQIGAPDPGQTIALRLTNTASVQIVFDRVQLTLTSVPEPALAGAVAGAGALMAAGWWRRRSRARRT